MHAPLRGAPVGNETGALRVAGWVVAVGLTWAARVEQACPGVPPAVTESLWSVRGRVL